MAGNDPDAEGLVQRDVEEEVGLVEGDAVNLQVYARAHDLVPAVYAADDPSRAFKGAGAAEGVCEGGVGGEVMVQRRFLD